MPCIPLAKVNTVSVNHGALGAQDDVLLIGPPAYENPQTIDHAENQHHPKTKTFLWPILSPSLPAGSINVPKVMEYAAVNLSFQEGFSLLLCIIFADWSNLPRTLAQINHTKGLSNDQNWCNGHGEGGQR